MPTIKTTTKNFNELLKEIPDTAKRIKVIDVFGNEVWKKPVDLMPTDKINLDGQVVFTEFDRAEEAKKKAAEAKKAKDEPKPVEPSKSTSKTDEESEEVKKIKDKISRKKKYIQEDKLYQIIKKNPDSLETLQNIMLAFSEEQSSIDFEKNYLEEQGISASKLAMQRVRILQALGETWLSHKELLLQEKTGIVDLNSDSFGRLFKFIGETFTDVMLECGVDPQTIKMITVKTSKQIDETWKSKALRKMLGEDNN